MIKVSENKTKYVCSACNNDKAVYKIETIRQDKRVIYELRNQIYLCENCREELKGKL